MAGAIHSSKLEKQMITAKQNQEDPSKFYSHFLYKAVIVAILVILPLFPSQAPEFINQSLLTRNWELLHLLFVGIAISYGLFSRRNDETEKDNNTTFDNAHLVVSRFLQVSSFFEDEAESLSEPESDEIQVKTWGIQYHRKKPRVVLAPQHSNFEQQSATIGEKPLLLPVRSLKSRVSSDPGVVVQSDNVSSATPVSLSRPPSKSGSKRFSISSNSNGGELEGSGSPKVEDKVKENVVLPSPIPWRSSFSMDQESVESRSVKSQKSRSSRHSCISSSPKGATSPSPNSFSSESLAKNAEDLMRKKGFYKCGSPPPPPPPPPIFQKSISMKPRSSSFNEEASFDKELKRSFTSERDDLKWWSSGHRLMGRVDSEIEVKPKGHVENFSMGKSVRTVRADQYMAAFRSRGENKEEGMNGRLEKSQLEEAEEHFVEEPTRKTLGYDVSFRTDKLMGHASVPLVSEPASVEYSEEEKESFLDKVIAESDEDTETEDEEVEGRLVQKDRGESSKMDRPSSSNGDEGLDVDKQADEFIAKFREQIRLQRIESIKRSARITTRNSAR